MKRKLEQIERAPQAETFNARKVSTDCTKMYKLQIASFIKTTDEYPKKIRKNDITDAMGSNTSTVRTLYKLYR